MPQILVERGLSPALVNMSSAVIICHLSAARLFWCGDDATDCLLWLCAKAILISLRRLA